jgi:hypothetical protein
MDIISVNRNIQDVERVRQNDSTLKELNWRGNKRSP